MRIPRVLGPLLGGPVRSSASRPWRRAPRFGATRGIVTVLLAGAVLAIASGTGRAQTPEMITNVQIEGNAQTDEALIRETFGLDAGDRYQVDQVRQGVRNLWRQGLFRDIRVSAERSDGGIALQITVEENPTLLRVRYDGQDKLKEKDFAEVVQLVPGQLVSPAAVDQARRDLETLYRSKGYLLAKVEPELLGERRADLTFRINEGKKVQVEKIRFHGNEHVASDALRGVLKTKEDRWYRGGDFKEDVFDEDKERIVARLGEDGFVDAKIVDVRKTFSENQERLFLDIDVEEGPQYTVGKVDLDHGGEIPENRLRSAILLYEGQPFNTALFDESTSNLYSTLHEQGYIYANIDVRREPQDDGSIDVDWVLTERDPARINRIIVTGNTRTKEEVIRRELRVAPGDIFKRSRVIRSQREVFQLGYFNDIQMDSKTADRETGAIDLILNVDERQTGTASLGAGINSQAGLTGFLQLSQNNFLGNGQILSLRAEFGRFRTFDLSFTEPWLFGTPTTGGIDAFDTRRRYTEYIESRRGGGLRVGRPFPWLDYSSVSLRYSLAKYELDPEPGYEAEIGNPDPTTISALTGTFFRNSVDSPFFPTRGTSTRLVGEIAGTALGGNEDYFFATISTRSYFRTVSKFVLSLGANAGWLTGLDSANDVPFWKRFRLGGISSYGVRGYDDYDIVPNELFPSTGGRTFGIVSAELRYPVVQAVQALAFADAGNTWEGPGDFNLADLKRGAGLGVRIDVPMVGQLGFDYGYGFDRTARQGGPGWEFHFQIGGQTF
ncbi:MAG: outer membrane protein assembly factor BamA [Gemmatimonadetes bacterium]|nr:outer membrane protein assembly factor BamA [Gemmatimonadota bacterium]